MIIACEWIMQALQQIDNFKKITILNGGGGVMFLCYSMPRYGS